MTGLNLTCLLLISVITITYGYPSNITDVKDEQGLQIAVPIPSHEQNHSKVEQQQNYDETKKLREDIIELDKKNYRLAKKLHKMPEIIKKVIKSAYSVGHYKRRRSSSDSSSERSSKSKSLSEDLSLNKKLELEDKDESETPLKVARDIVEQIEKETQNSMETSKKEKLFNKGKSIEKISKESSDESKSKSSSKSSRSSRSSSSSSSESKSESSSSRSSKSRSSRSRSSSTRSSSSRSQDSSASLNMDDFPSAMEDNKNDGISVPDVHPQIIWPADHLENKLSVPPVYQEEANTV